MTSIGKNVDSSIKDLNTSLKHIPNNLDHQSLNEESNILNSKHQNRIDKLTAANGDIKNLLDATEIAMIDLQIDLQNYICAIATLREKNKHDEMN